jgi:hypothetical protein
MFLLLFYQIIFFFFFEMKFIYLLAAVMIVVGVQAHDLACNCAGGRDFSTKYCCDTSQGTMNKEKGACYFPSNDLTKSDKFEKCCTSAGAFSKCR